MPDAGTTLFDFAGLRRRSEEVTRMAHCPECESDLELDGYDLDIGETINCPECSIELRIVANDPVSVSVAAEEE